jgi:hypothetical protein
MIAGVDVWQCKKCMKPTSELSECRAVPNRESKDFVSREKAIRDLARLPLEERLKIMIHDGATVDEVKAEIEASGLIAVDEPKPELVIKRIQPEQEIEPITPADFFKKEPPKDEDNS